MHIHVPDSELLPSTHGLIFFIIDEQIRVKIRSCVPTFGPILSNYLSAMKNWIASTNYSLIENLSDIIQQRDLPGHCHSTITPIKKIKPCAPIDTSTKNCKVICFVCNKKSGCVHWHSPTKIRCSLHCFLGPVSESTSWILRTQLMQLPHKKGIKLYFIYLLGHFKICF